ncbi:MAG: GNAT family N-acetyltransferase [Alphaproteobacteria bacterium]
MTGQATEIRPLAADDEAPWRGLWTAYLDFYDTRVDEQVYRTTFARLLAGNGGAAGEFQGRLALLGGQPVGLTHFLFHRHGWQVADVCYLQDLYVAPDQRGKGIGRALIQAVYEAADAAGVTNVWWLTQDFNADARALYDKVAKLTPFIKYTRL